MNVPCNVIEDLLPMYCDNVCSEDSVSLVEDHLKDCPYCKNMLADMRREFEIEASKPDDIKPLKKIQKSYKEMKLRWLIALVLIVALIPVAFAFGNEQGKTAKIGEYVPDYTKDEALADANVFMSCLVDGDYKKAFEYWDIEEEKYQLLSGNLFDNEKDLASFEADGLKKFCDGGKALDDLGGIRSFEFRKISDPSYATHYGTEYYLVSYNISFNGNTEVFSVGLTKNGIANISSGDGLINHPITHLTLWVQWVVDDYKGLIYDRDLGKWVEAGS